MQDKFSTHYSGLTAPAEHAEAITPSDSADLDFATRAIYVGGSGSLRITTIAGDTVTFPGVAGGVIYPFRARRVLANGTNATGLVGLR